MHKQVRAIADTSKEVFAGKRVLVRVPFDIPIQDGIVLNDFRIREALPTITFLQECGAKVILLSHCGRDQKATLAPVHTALQKYIPEAVFVPALSGDAVVAAIAILAPRGVLLLENVRSNVGEIENDDAFAQSLAALGEVYVNDAFSVAHRAHASIVGIPKYLPSYAGISFMREVHALEKVLSPESPSLLILGGAKFDTKLPLVQKFLALYDCIFIGGALANDIWRARGIAVGTSLVAKDVVEKNIANNSKIILPVDVVVKNANGALRTTVPLDVHADEAILDAGPATALSLKYPLENIKTVLWNGPLGNYEEGFTQGTESLARIIADSTAFSVVGGGDTVAAIEALGINDKFGFVSTAGGAMLEFLEKGTLPGIDALVAS